jgi:hypothetical protein
MGEPAAVAGGVRRIELHRRVVILRPERIEVRPSRRALRGPLLAFLAGVLSFAAIALGLSTLPMFLLVPLLLVAVFTIPLAGIGVVYALVGAHVVVDAAKQTATWQQGMIGLGIGTEELVPFAKVAAIVVEEAGLGPQSTGRMTEEFAQWQIVLEKASGKRLVIGGVTAARALSDQALARASAVAEAIAALTAAPLRLPAAEPDKIGARPVTRRPRRHRRRHGARRA